jgi:O-antigen/teichoic acid export membrane protein
MNTSLNRRVISSFVSNVFRAGVSFLTGILIARWLEPENYGRLAYLLATFAVIKQIFDLSTSSAFFTFISNKKRSLYFIQIYFGFIIIQLLVILGLIAIILPDFIIKFVWGSESRLLLILAFLAVFMQNTIWPLFYQLGEAQRKTAKVQFVNNIFVIVHFLIICAAFYFEKLTIVLILISIIFEWLLASWFIRNLYIVNDKFLSENELHNDNFKNVYKKYLIYCLPLIPYVFLSFSHDFFDRWMLQKWGGSIEQSYFSIGQQIAAIALIATVSVQRVIWKEFAEAIENNNLFFLKKLFINASNRLFFFAAFISGIMLPLIPYFVKNLLGSKYNNAGPVIGIMLLYPIHQVYGQMGFTLLYATEKNKLQSRLGQFFIITSLIISFFVLAPSNNIIPGFGLKSVGLAWKLVLLQIIHVNILLYYISLEFKWKLDFIYQFKILGFFLFLGWLVRQLIFTIFLQNQFEFFTIFLYFTLCFLFTLSLILFKPSLIGLDKNEIKLISIRVIDIFNYKSKI